LRQALVGRFHGHHPFLVAQILAHLDNLDEAIGAVSAHIDTLQFIPPKSMTLGA